MDGDEPVTVYRAWNSQQAELVRELLAEAGITARVASDAAEAARGYVPYQKVTCPVLVHQRDLDRARAVIGEIEHRLLERAQGHEESAEPFCYHCGEPVAVNQSPCPHCGQELDWSNQPG